jgi:beta-carotene ketolase (CrtW type)
LEPGVTTSLVDRPLNKPENKAFVPLDRNGWGLLIATVIIGLWFSNLLFWLSRDLSQIQLISIIPAIVIQTFLYTGLFITAHDAMHFALFPHHRNINDLVGSIALFLYALFPYKKLLKNHWLHHNHSASNKDPDFHNGKHSHPMLWYFQFFQKYFSWKQLLGLSIIFFTLNLVFSVDRFNLIAFWIIPSILSSVQLFCFGIYFPHREPTTGYTNSHRAQSNNLPTLFSFLACYHFGYHEEHHEQPSVPWWQLPIVRRQRLQEQIGHN